MANEQEFHLGNLVAAPGSRQKKTRVGRGTGSGLGKTAGRGGKGQTARSGKGRPKGFEGGQTPLIRRLPKFGFKNPFKKYFETVNVSDLEKRFEKGETVDPQKLVEKGIIKNLNYNIKVLGDGVISKNLTVKAHRFSKSAIQKINQAGGSIEEIKVGSG